MLGSVPKPDDSTMVPLRCLYTVIIAALLVSSTFTLLPFLDSNLQSHAQLTSQSGTQYDSSCTVFIGAGGTAEIREDDNSHLVCYQFSTPGSQVSLNWSASPKPVDFGVSFGPYNQDANVTVCVLIVGGLYSARNASAGEWNLSSDGPHWSTSSFNPEGCYGIAFGAQSVGGGPIGQGELVNITIRWFPG
jgi:hypothetical protein